MRAPFVSPAFTNMPPPVWLPSEILCLFCVSFSFSNSNEFSFVPLVCYLCSQEAKEFVLISGHLIEHSSCFLSSASSNSPAHLYPLCKKPPESPALHLCLLYVPLWQPFNPSLCFWSHIFPRIFKWLQICKINCAALTDHSFTPEQ